MSYTLSFHLSSIKTKDIFTILNDISTQDTYAKSLDGSNITDKFVLSLDGSNNKDKDASFQLSGIMSDTNARTERHNARTDSMPPQNVLTLQPKDQMLLLCINTLPLQNADHLLKQQHVSAMPTPVPSPSSSYSFVNRADQVPPCGSHGWYGALLNDDQSLSNLKDVREALCQM